MTVPKTPSKNVTAVQVPGANAPAIEQSKDANTGNAGTLPAADNPEAGTEVKTGNADGGATTTLDSEAVAALQAENDDLRAQIEAAGRQRAPAKDGEAAPGKAPLSRSAYLSMRAHEVDPNTLTKSVLTLDGWVCPPQLTKPQPN